MSDDYADVGHSNFTWMKEGTEHDPVHDSFYGKHTYEVEPQGLHAPYDLALAYGNSKNNRSINRVANQPTWITHGTTWASLGGAKVIRKVPKPTSPPSVDELTDLLNGKDRNSPQGF